MFSFLAVAALVAIVAASPTDTKKSICPNGRIIGGESAVIETYPYQVSIEIYGRHNCGGSIIAKNYVLTAGHCVGANMAYLSIRAGTSFASKGGSVHQIEKIVRHEKFRLSNRGVPINDIAIIRVKEPFQFDDSRQPIDLFDSLEKCEAGVNSIVTGWGYTGFSNAYQLQTVTIPIITRELCDKAYNKLFGDLPVGQVCAAYYGVGGKDACQGDSGGPLAIDGRLAGIVSWGNGCAKPYYPGVYTEVAHYRKWINENVEF